MSAPAANETEIEEVEEQKNLSKEQAAESKQLDKVTDFAEDVEMDLDKAQAALTNLTSSLETEESIRQARELASIQVKSEDIELLAAEFEISQDEAEKKIREAKGDVKLAITNLL